MVDQFDGNGTPDDSTNSLVSLLIPSVDAVNEESLVLKRIDSHWMGHSGQNVYQSSESDLNRLRVWLEHASVALQIGASINRPVPCRMMYRIGQYSILTHPHCLCLIWERESIRKDPKLSCSRYYLHVYLIANDVAHILSVCIINVGDLIEHCLQHGWNLILAWSIRRSQWVMYLLRITQPIDSSAANENSCVGNHRHLSTISWMSTLNPMPTQCKRGSIYLLLTQKSALPRSDCRLYLSPCAYIAEVSVGRLRHCQWQKKSIHFECDSSWRWSCDIGHHRMFETKRNQRRSNPFHYNYNRSETHRANRRILSRTDSCSHGPQKTPAHIGAALLTLMLCRRWYFARNCIWEMVP